ncbi:hypothetical protein CcCBS67573_g02672 [Chytriomyces confervae]|uniref:Uncharacterized protein n=1 Tax=Chytriomyces confervae TaxID=246404 RepID=A0A507FK17_9FUNG|nr:hypothetical protein CcCBS67573_g02672 [Chytriomyces confervae]
MDPTKLSLAHSSVAHQNRPQPCPEPIEIGDGLVMRQATAEDRDELATFNAVTHFPAGGRMTLNWFNGTHPTIDPSCFSVVVDTAKEAKPIISSVMSIPQVWLYGSPSAVVGDGDLGGYVAMPVTRIEAVGTSPEYRSKGLVQKHLDIHHKWAEQDLKSPLQYIGGIPFYYKRFGYENCPERGGGFSGTYATIGGVITTVAEHAKKVTFRLASGATDAQFVTRVNRLGCVRRNCIWTDIDESEWLDVFHGRQEAGLSSRSVWIIQVAQSEGTEPLLAVGFVVMCSVHQTAVRKFELDDAAGISWTIATEALLAWLPSFYTDFKVEFAKRYSAPFVLSSQGNEGIAAVSDTAAAAAAPALPNDWKFMLLLGKHHPCYLSVAKSNFPGFIKPETWFTRIPSPKLFLQAIIPVLNARLVESITFARVTQSVLVTKSVGNLVGCPVIHIQDGKVASVEDSPPGTVRQDLAKKGIVPAYFDGNAINRVFLGHQTVWELEEAGGVLGHAMALQILSVLFPKMVSDDIIGFD